MLRYLRKYHKWFSLAATLFILFFAVSGIILNHRELLSGIDLSRKLLPPVYRYANWNLASVRGSLTTGGDSVLLYGNIGVWLTDSHYRKFSAMNEGFPAGIDNRKVNSMTWSSSAGLWAGTLFGLYRWEGDKRGLAMGSWQRAVGSRQSAVGGWRLVELPGGHPRVVKVLVSGDSLLVMTRSSVFLAEALTGYRTFREIRLPRGEDDDGKMGLFRTLWVIHSGEIYGLPGKLIVDAVGAVFIILCITGLVYFFVPYRLKRLKDAVRRKRLKIFNRFALRWHNLLGSWAILILLLNTTTGMFLRPPLLIPIASSRVGKIPLTELDDPNPWSDRLRDLLYDADLKRFLLATSEGIYYSDDGFNSSLKVFPVQPPVSVMGINVFEKSGTGRYLVGSFSGIFEWEPGSGRTVDCITRTEYADAGGSGPPFGSVSVAGMIRCGDSAWLIFDYPHGVMALAGKNPLPVMPAPVLEASPISFWNTALEIHTGRIFEPILGPFYILVVPLIGLATLVILVSGFLAWWMARRSTQT